MTREELEKLLAAATPGPWEVSERTKDWRPQVVSTEHGPICTMHIPEVGDADPNAALICAAVNALPELLEENEKLREALRLFMGAATPVSTEIDPRGYVWSLGYLDQARTALKETGHE